MMHGGAAGIPAGWKAFKSGISYMEGADRLRQMTEEARAGGQGMLEGTSPMGEALQRPHAIGDALEAVKVPASIAQPVGKALEMPGNVVQGIHTVFYGMNYEREIARRAFRQA